MLLMLLMIDFSFVPCTQRVLTRDDDQDICSLPGWARRARSNLCFNFKGPQLN